MSGVIRIPREISELELPQFLYEKVPYGQKGFGHIISLRDKRAVIYMVEKIKALASYSERPSIHVHFIAVDLIDYINSKMTPLDFKDLFIDYQEFIRRYSSFGEWPRLLSSLPSEYAPGDTSTGVDRASNIMIYRDEQSILIFYEPHASIESTVKRLFTDVRELYLYNFVLDFEVSEVGSHVIMLPSSRIDTLRYRLRGMNSIDLNSLKQVLKQKVRTTCSEFARDLSFNLSELENFTNKDMALEKINRLKRSVMQVRYIEENLQCLDDSQKAILFKVQNQISFLSELLHRQEPFYYLLNGLNEEILRYSIIKEQIKSSLYDIANRALLGEMRREDILLLERLSNLEPNLYRYFLDLVILGIKKCAPSCIESLFGILKILADNSSHGSQSSIKLGEDIVNIIYTNSDIIDYLVDRVSSPEELLYLIEKLLPSHHSIVSKYKSKLKEIEEKYKEEARSIIKSMIKEIATRGQRRWFLWRI